MVKLIRCGFLLLPLAGCSSVQIAADGTTRIRTLGAVTVETHACSAAGEERSAPDAHVCVGVGSGSLSETAGGLVSSVIKSILGR